jgi:hypothetical protein
MYTSIKPFAGEALVGFAGWRVLGRVCLFTSLHRFLKLERFMV